MGAPDGARRFMCEQSAWISAKSAAVTATENEKSKTSHLRGFHGASGTRTRALLGAISEALGPEFVLFRHLSAPDGDSPNIFPNTLPRVLRCDNGVGRVLVRAC